MTLKPSRLRDGRIVAVRPAVPDDADPVVAFHGLLSPRSRGLSLFGPLRRLSSDDAALIVTPDRDDRAALVATEGLGGGPVVGLAYLDRTGPDQARFALAVRDDYQGAGLGAALFRCLVETAAGLGIARLEGSILPENTAMLRLAERQGARPVYRDEAEVLVAVPIHLAAAEAPCRRVG